MDHIKAMMQAMNDKNSPFYVQPEQFEMVPVKGIEKGLKCRNGQYLPFLVRNLSVTKNMDVREDDTFVVTFPKSGNCCLGVYKKQKQACL